MRDIGYGPVVAPRPLPEIPRDRVSRRVVIRMCTGSRTHASGLASAPAQEGAATNVQRDLRYSRCNCPSRPTNPWMRALRQVKLSCVWSSRRGARLTAQHKLYREPAPASSGTIARRQGAPELPLQRILKVTRVAAMPSQLLDQAPRHFLRYHPADWNPPYRSSSLDAPHASDLAYTAPPKPPLSRADSQRQIN